MFVLVRPILRSTPKLYYRLIPQHLLRHKMTQRIFSDRLSRAYTTGLPSLTLQLGPITLTSKHLEVLSFSPRQTLVPKIGPFMPLPSG